MQLTRVALLVALFTGPQAWAHPLDDSLSTTSDLHGHGLSARQQVKLGPCYPLTKCSECGGDTKIQGWCDKPGNGPAWGKICPCLKDDGKPEPQEKEKSPELVFPCFPLQKCSDPNCGGDSNIKGWCSKRGSQFAKDIFCPCIQDNGKEGGSHNDVGKPCPEDHGKPKMKCSAVECGGDKRKNGQCDRLVLIGEEEQKCVKDGSKGCGAICQCEHDGVNPALALLPTAEVGNIGAYEAAGVVGAVEAAGGAGGTAAGVAGTGALVAPVLAIGVIAKFASEFRCLNAPLCSSTSCAGIDGKCSQGLQKGCGCSPGKRCPTKKPICPSCEGNKEGVCTKGEHNGCKCDPCPSDDDEHQPWCEDCGGLDTLTCTKDEYQGCPCFDPPVVGVAGVDEKTLQAVLDFLKDPANQAQLKNPGKPKDPVCHATTTGISVNVEPFEEALKAFCEDPSKPYDKNNLKLTLEELEKSKEKCPKPKDDCKDTLDRVWNKCTKEALGKDQGELSFRGKGEAVGQCGTYTVQVPVSNGKPTCKATGKTKITRQQYEAARREFCEKIPKGKTAQYKSRTAGFEIFYEELGDCPNLRNDCISSMNELWNECDASKTCDGLNCGKPVDKPSSTCQGAFCPSSNDKPSTAMNNSPGPLKGSGTFLSKCGNYTFQITEPERPKPKPTLKPTTAKGKFPPGENALSFEGKPFEVRCAGQQTFFSANKTRDAMDKFFSGFCKDGKSLSPGSVENKAEQKIDGAQIMVEAVSTGNPGSLYKDKQVCDGFNKLLRKDDCMKALWKIMDTCNPKTLGGSWTYNCVNWEAYTYDS